MNESELTPQQEWDCFLSILGILGEINPLKGMAKEVLDHCICINYICHEPLTLYEIKLRILPEHKHLWSAAVRDKLTGKIHDWLDSNIIGNVVLAIEDDVHQIVCLPQTKTVLEKCAMYEKELTNPVQH